MKATPKFCVGEEVMVRGEDVGLDSDRTEIISMKWKEDNMMFCSGNGDFLKAGWFYKTPECSTGIPSKVRPGRTIAWCREDSLRKLPPEDKTSWEDCAFTPSNLEVRV